MACYQYLGIRTLFSTVQLLHVAESSPRCLGGSSLSGTMGTPKCLATTSPLLMLGLLLAWWEALIREQSFYKPDLHIAPYLTCTVLYYFS